MLKIDFAGMGEEGGEPRPEGAQGGRGPKGRRGRRSPASRAGRASAAIPKAPEEATSGGRPVAYVAGASPAFIHFVCITKRSTGRKFAKLGAQVKTRK